MIIDFSDKYKKETFELLEKKKKTNMYLYIDFFSYGYLNDNINTYILINNKKEAIVLVYNYYNSLQLLSFRENVTDQINELIDFIKNNNIKRISGDVCLLTNISKCVKCHLEIGNILIYENNNFLNDIKIISKASLSDANEICDLLLSDIFYQNSYSKDDLLNQIKSRIDKTYIVRRDGIIVAHITIAAQYNNIVVISGVITHKNYRKIGIGSNLLLELSSICINENKDVFLYCYDKDILKWYKKLGYSIVSQTAKITF